MKKIVQQILDPGIRPKNNPYSSPILLVKRKKMGDDNFCVDYRAFNNIIVLDKFPIWAIDEHFDELGEVTIFSKMDLKSRYH